APILNPALVLKAVARIPKEYAWVVGFYARPERSRAQRAGEGAGRGSGGRHSGNISVNRGSERMEARSSSSQTPAAQELFFLPERGARASIAVSESPRSANTSARRSASRSGRNSGAFPNSARTPRASSRRPRRASERPSSLGSNVRLASRFLYFGSAALSEEATSSRSGLASSRLPSARARRALSIFHQLPFRSLRDIWSRH